MDKYKNIINKYKDNPPPVLQVIEAILLESGAQGASLKEIYATLELIGFTFDASVIRGYMNRNIVGSNIKGGHNLWYRKDRGVFVSPKNYVNK